MKITRKGQVIDVPGNQPGEGEVAPDFALHDMQDATISLASLKGQPTIISIIPDINPVSVRFKPSVLIKKPVN